MYKIYLYVSASATESAFIWFYFSYPALVGFCPTVLSVVPLARCVVCLSVICLSVCDVLYCGKMVRPSKKVSEEVNRKPGSKKLIFLGRRHISTSGFATMATEMAIFCLMYCGETVRPSKKVSYFCPYSPAIGTRWYK